MHIEYVLNIIGLTLIIFYYVFCILMLINSNKVKDYVIKKALSSWYNDSKRKIGELSISTIKRMRWFIPFNGKYESILSSWLPQYDFNFFDVVGKKHRSTSQRTKFFASSAFRSISSTSEQSDIRNIKEHKTMNGPTTSFILDLFSLVNKNGFSTKSYYNWKYYSRKVLHKTANTVTSFPKLIMLWSKSIVPDRVGAGWLRVQDRSEREGMLSSTTSLIEPATSGQLDIFFDPVYEDWKDESFYPGQLDHIVNMEHVEDNFIDIKLVTKDNNIVRKNIKKVTFKNPLYFDYNDIPIKDSVNKYISESIFHNEGSEHNSIMTISPRSILKGIVEGEPIVVSKVQDENLNNMNLDNKAEHNMKEQNDIDMEVINNNCMSDRNRLINSKTMNDVVSDNYKSMRFPMSMSRLRDDAMFSSDVMTRVVSSCPLVAGSIRLVVEDNMPSRSDRPSADLNVGLYFPPEAEKTAERSWTRRQPDHTTSESIGVNSNHINGWVKIDDINRWNIIR